MTQTFAASSSSSPPSPLSSVEEAKIPEEVARPAQGLISDDSQDEPSDFTRLEALLFARTRSHGDLQRESARRDRLFREALVRISTSTSQEFSALRGGYDAAVARAIEAEVARAELTFALDETRAQLTAATPSGSVGDQTHAPGVYGVYAGAADHGVRAALASDNADLRRRAEAVRGELSGVRARLVESEQAWQAAVSHSQKLQQRFSSTQERINELRTESAELTLLAQTRAGRIAELTQAAALDQQEIRTLRAQVSAATAAQVAQSEAREADRQLWTERVQKHEEREQEAWNVAASAVARSELRLREFLGSLEAPLRELDASIDTLSSAGVQRPETAQPGARFDVAADARASEPSAASTPSSNRRITDELASERDRRTKLLAAVRALQAATQSGEPTKPWIEELVELVAESRPSARRRS